MKSAHLIIFVLLIISQNTYSNPAPWVGTTLNGAPCSEREGGVQAIDPIDYNQRLTNKNKHILPLVEGAHFTSDVENLIKGHRGWLEGDLDYTLRSYPNHHRALLSVIRYQKMYLKELISRKLMSPPECYLQRAIKFSPNDANSYAIYGYYLKEMNLFDQTEKMYNKAIELSPNNPKFEYAYGQLLVNLKRYPEAVEMAKLAYKHGSPPKHLKNRLIEVGAWKNED